MSEDRYTYRGRKASAISFPLGGIGTGCIGLAGNGRLIDWEIFNRPNKGSVNGFSHFAIRAERGGEVVDARVLHGDLPPHYMGSLSDNRFNTFGFGPPRQYLTGLPHFRDVVFRGKFPFAKLDFIEGDFPADVKLTAFNPFIPLNARDSGIPAAFFTFEVTNTTSEPLTYTLAGTLHNPLPAPNLNRLSGSALSLRSAGVDADSANYGDMTLATDAEDVGGQAYWFRGRWFDALEVYWHDFTTPGRLPDRHYTDEDAGEDNTGTLAAHFTLESGNSKAVRFVIAWNFPNVQNYWNKAAVNAAGEFGIPETWRNAYATVWEDSAASASYALSAWDRLESETRRFADALFISDLPPVALEAVSANLSTLKSPTVLRLEDGTFYGFEGCHPSSGCCEGSCTHVWNYAQALPFLFPSLERSMRKADYAYNLRPDGGMPFRLQLPLGVRYSEMRPCADGQFGGVMKAYRDWKISGDTEWLRALWPAIRRSIAFAWSDENADRWDPEQTGILQGRQHHTLDMELFGPNAWLTGFYLGALKAGAEMADALGEVEIAAEYRALFEKGRAWADANLFNGEYYFQRIDLADRDRLCEFDAGENAMTGERASDAYWSAEHGEMKYQIGEGCGIDQVLAQWHADLYGLGDLFDPAQVESALRAVFRHNFKSPMRDFFNPCRVFSLNDEAGLVICDWPEGSRKPVVPIPYAQETMTGFEYAAATHMIARDLTEQGMAVVEAVRERFDGEKRNPWNEFECGSNYARAMASYALLNAFSGFRFDMTAGLIGFDPVMPGDFRCFWSLDPAWGIFERKSGSVELRVLYGELGLKVLILPDICAPQSVTLEGQNVLFEFEDGKVTLESAVLIQEGQSLKVV
jgi:uncharacterized protein (DUF608 family)